ncbi:MAG: alpha/beta hydrolase family protein [Syntrophales bacterium]|nr:alpha/beta hydrolase family protein [Syntrophales bacterium]
MVSRIDLLYAFVANRKRFFTGGWGDIGVLQSLVGDYAPPTGNGTEIEINWMEDEHKGFFSIKRGFFDSPARDVGLPEQSRQAYVEWIMPADSTSHTPITIHFAATGDEGFSRRRMAFGLPLARRGVGSVILENPYYGRRRPRAQEGKFLPYVSDLWKMGRASTEEGLAISRWLRRQGYKRLIACGVSMGGHIAAKVANFSSEPMGCVAFLAPHSAEAVYLQGILSKYVAWEVLEREARGDFAVRDFFRAVLSQTDIRTTPPRYSMKAALIIGALKDAYIPRESVETLKKHWPDARLKWVRGGHVTAFLLHREALIQGVWEVLREL